MNNIILEAVDLYMSAPQKKQVDTSQTSRQEKVNEPPLIEIDSDDDNEKEIDFEKRKLKVTKTWNKLSIVSV